MEPQVTPTDKEISIPDGALVISKTDMQGHITYCNRAFMNISGYSQLELTEHQHLTTWHPDMPRGIYRILRRCIERREEFIGYIKNLSSDGSPYWAHTVVTPDLDSTGTAMGCFSVRRKPDRTVISTLIPIYEGMLAIEKGHSTERILDESVDYLHEKLKDMNTSYNEFVLSHCR